jgi:hypoxanthine phosphoribosyltransferase
MVNTIPSTTNNQSLLPPTSPNMPNPLSRKAKKTTIHDKTFSLSIPAVALHREVTRLGVQITADYADKCPIFLAILNGAFIFTADLVRACDELECETVFVKLQSYQGMASTDQVTTVLGITQSLKGRHIIITEDIIDTGKTLHHFIAELEKQEPASIAIAACLVKPDAMRYPLDIQYACFQIPNDFVVGYGLDYDGIGRNLRGIYSLTS